VPSDPLDIDFDQLVHQVFAATPLDFVRDFLREQKRRDGRVRIGLTREEVRANLRDAIVQRLVPRSAVVDWLHAAAGWGKQHMYLFRVPRRTLATPVFLNHANLRNALERAGVWPAGDGRADPESPHLVDWAEVDDERATINWQSTGIRWERREDLDQTKETDDGVFQWRAYKRDLRRNASRMVFRKTDGTVLFLLSNLLDDSEHEEMAKRMKELLSVLASTQTVHQVDLAPVVTALDQEALATIGQSPSRGVNLGISPTQTRFRGDGARLEFKSTTESSEYARTRGVRRVREALRVEQFLGESGKFRLRFRGEGRREHAMVVSLYAFDNRCYLYSSMDEAELMQLVDEILQRG
jgi:hypothetical protein